MAATMQKHFVLSSENCVRLLTALSGWKVELTCNRFFPALLKHRVQAVRHDSFPYSKSKGTGSTVTLMWAKHQTQKLTFTIYAMPSTELQGRSSQPTGQVLTHPEKSSPLILKALQKKP